MQKLHDAARAGDPDALADWLEEGADVHSRTLRGQTALMLAAGSTSCGTVDAVKLLLAATARIDDVDKNGWTALHHACRNSQQDVVDVLLEHKASIKVPANDGKTVAMLAAMDFSDALVMQLVTRGGKAFLHARDEKGWPLLFFACEDNRYDLVKWLLHKNASPNEAADDGNTPLMIAAEQGHKQLGRRLFRASADLNSRNHTGDTSLMIALRSLSVDFADWLLREGCEVACRNKYKEDAREIASLMGLPGMKLRLERKLCEEADRYWAHKNEEDARQESVVHDDNHDCSDSE